MVLLGLPSEGLLHIHEEAFRVSPFRTCGMGHFELGNLDPFSYPCPTERVSAFCMSRHESCVPERKLCSTSIEDGT